MRSSLIIILLYLSSIHDLYGQNEQNSMDGLKKDVEWIGTCQTSVIEKAEIKGFNSLTLKEKINYYIDTYRCEYKSEAKKVHRHIDEQQLKEDASNSGKFFGKSGSIAYCTMALLLFLTLT